MITLDTRSLARLDEAHPDIKMVVLKAAELSDLEFIVTETKRSQKRQAELYTAGASKTMDSRHLIQACGYPCAFDVAVKVAGEVRWDWPLYSKIAVVIKEAAKQVGVPIEWGGDWKTFKDGPHFQLPKNDPRYR